MATYRYNKGCSLDCGLYRVDNGKVFRLKYIVTDSGKIVDIDRILRILGSDEYESFMRWFNRNREVCRYLVSEDNIERKLIKLWQDGIAVDKLKRTFEKRKKISDGVTEFNCKYTRISLEIAHLNSSLPIVYRTDNFVGYAFQNYAVIFLGNKIGIFSAFPRYGYMPCSIVARVAASGKFPRTKYHVKYKGIHFFYVRPDNVYEYFDEILWDVVNEMKKYGFEDFKKIALRLML